MDVRFDCPRCGAEKIVPDPTKSSFRCDCGGMLRLLGPASKGKGFGTPMPEQTVGEDGLMGLLIRKGGAPQEYIKRFKVCVCPECGMVQITEAKTFRCRRDGCSCTRVFRTLGDWHIKLYDTDDIEDARKKLKGWSRQGMKHERFID